MLRPWNNDRSKDIKRFKNFLTVSIYWRRYDEHYKRKNKFPKAIWTSPILGIKSTCLKSSRERRCEWSGSIGIPKTLRALKVVLNKAWEVKSIDKSYGDQATHYEIGLYVTTKLIFFLNSFTNFSWNCVNFKFNGLFCRIQNTSLKGFWFEI